MRLIRGNLFQSIITNRALIVEMAWRDIQGTGRGALIGYLWLVVSPLIQTIAYIFIVSIVFGARLPEASGRFDYAMYVLAGMVPWHLLTRTLQESTTLIRDRTELVKQVIYPIETLPVTSLLVSSISSMVVLLVLLGISAITGSIEWSVLLLPIPIAILAIFLLGVSWIASIAGVVLKDLRDIVAILMNLMVYVSPVLLTKGMVGESLWSLIMLNPLSHIVISFRDVFEGTFHWGSWAVFIAMTVAATITGGWIVYRTKIAINEYL